VMLFKVVRSSGQKWAGVICMGGGVFDRPKKEEKERKKEKFNKEYSASNTHLFLVLALCLPSKR
jgi:hypothetical protein